MAKKLSQTNFVKKLRLFFGISQQDFARYLSISRSMLSMVETDERELPGIAATKYAALVAMVYGEKGLAEQPITLPPLTAADKKIWEEKITECEWEAEKYHRQLAAMKEAYEQATHALTLCEQLLPSLPNNKEGKKDRLILEIIQSDAKKTIAQNGAGAQAMLQWKIDGYVSGAARAREIGIAKSKQ